MLHRPLLSFLFVVLFVSGSYGQESEGSGPDKDKFLNRVFSDGKFFTGGNIGLAIGNITFIDVSPVIGYNITDDLSAGVGFTYNYFRYKDVNPRTGEEFVFSANYYGGRLFGRYFFADYLFAHAEYEVLNLEFITEVDWNKAEPIETTRTWIGSPLVGAGYASRYSGSAYWYIMLLYNLNELSPAISPYPNPLIRVGATIDL